MPSDLGSRAKARVPNDGQGDKVKLKKRQYLINLIGYRVGRALTKNEIEALDYKLERLSEERVAQAAYEALSAESLLRWLHLPDSV